MCAVPRPPRFPGAAALHPEAPTAKHLRPVSHEAIRRGGGHHSAGMAPGGPHTNATTGGCVPVPPTVSRSPSPARSIFQVGSRLTCHFAGLPCSQPRQIPAVLGDSCVSHLPFRASSRPHRPRSWATGPQRTRPTPRLWTKCLTTVRPFPPPVSPLLACGGELFRPWHVHQRIIPTRMLPF